MKAPTSERMIAHDPTITATTMQELIMCFVGKMREYNQRIENFVKVIVLGYKNSTE